MAEPVGASVRNAKTMKVGTMGLRVDRPFQHAITVLAFAVAGIGTHAQEPATAAVPTPEVPAAGISASAKEVRLELLRDCWTSSAENRQRAPVLYAALQRGASYVPADDYLYGLVRFKHNQYDEAEAAIDRALERSPKDLMFLKTHVWIALARKRGDQALAALAKFQEILFAEGEDSARSASARADDLNFLGQVYGYLAIAPERLTPESVEKLRDAVAEELAIEDLRTFETAERETQRRYDALTQEKEAAVASFNEAADAAAAEKMTEFEERRRQLQERRVDLDAQSTAAVEAAKAEVGNLGAAQLQARQAVGVLMNQLAPARQQYSQQLESIERLRNSLIAVQFGDFTASQLVINQLQAAQQQAAAMEAELQIAERNYAQASSALININREIAVKEATHGQKVNELRRALQQIDAEIKKLDKEEEKALGKGAGTTVAIRQLSQKVGALGSYVDYDLEIPRLKLIEYLERR